jgi:pSer/pThr/pTyr-binding forkhead associated (FHA) protein
MPYIEFVSPSKLSIRFRSTAKIYRQGYDVFVEADGIPYRIGVDLTVSRRVGGRDAHAVISVESGKVYVMDLGSTNGTHVNSAKIEPYKRVEISPSDTITIGYFTTIRIVPEFIKEETREERGSIDIATTMLLNIRKCLTTLLREGIQRGLEEFEAFWNAYKEWLEPCKLHQGICEAYNNAYLTYQTLKIDKYARTQQNIKSFEEALAILEKTLEKATHYRIKT